MFARTATLVNLQITDMITILCRFILFASIAFVVEPAGTRMKEMFNWKHIEFSFENETQKQSMIENGLYIMANIIPTSIALWNDKLFVTTPRFKLGVPASLSYIMVNLTGNDSVTLNKTSYSAADTETEVKSPELIPYPNLEVHDLQLRNVTSILNVEVDNCDRLWAIDCGQIEYKHETDPVIMIYDLRTNLLLDSQKIKTKTDYKMEPFLADILVDVTSSNCDNAYVYIPDANNYELIVYNMKGQEFHKVSHNYFHFDPLCGDLDIDGIHYQSQHGIFSLSMSPVGRDDHRILYFSPLASLMQFAVPTKVIQNKTLDTAKSYYEFKVMGSKGINSQSCASSFDEETGVLFYTLISKNAIGCWNSFSGDEYSEKTQGVITEDKSLIYPSDVEVDKNGLLWAIFNNQPKFLHSTLDSDEINFRILRGAIRSMIKGTVCDSM